MSWFLNEVLNQFWMVVDDYLTGEVIYDGIASQYVEGIEEDADFHFEWSFDAAKTMPVLLVTVLQFK